MNQQQESSKLRHDIRSDLNSIFNAIRLVADDQRMPEDLGELLSLVLEKQDNLEHNIGEILK
jgi:hypothetical protein